MSGHVFCSKSGQVRTHLLVLQSLQLVYLVEHLAQAVPLLEHEGRLAQRFDALSCGENFQEVDAVERIDRHERVLREVHRRDDVLRDPLRVRQLREHAKALQPADHRKEDEAA